MRRGDVWWVDHPTYGRRPFLILTRNETVRSLAKPLCAAITSVIRELPTEVVLDEGDGMSRRCVVSLDNIEPVSKRFFAERQTQLTPARMVEVCRAIAIATGC